ncbi:MAG: hypothetical protein SFV81_01485 [Pirellulaceae bacterium]|nr:hypothetical protein [Pirellulaceae bacterium]
MCYHLRKSYYAASLALLGGLLLSNATAQVPPVQVPTAQVPIAQGPTQAGQRASSLPRFQEANEQRVITRTFSNSTFDIPLTLYSTPSSSSAEATASVKTTLTLGPIGRSDNYLGKSARINSPLAGQEFVVAPNTYLPVNIQGELPEFTTYRSWLMLTSGEESVVYNLMLERRPFQLTLLGATNNRLELSTSSREIKVPLTFKLADGQSDLTQLQLAISSFAREDGRAIEREKLEIAEAGPLDIKVGEFRTLSLVGKQMLPGKYWAKLTIRDRASAQVFDLLLNCVEPTQRIALVPITNTSATVWWWSAEARVKLIVDETAGRLADVYQPHVESIERLNNFSGAVNLADIPITIIADGSSARNTQITSDESKTESPPALPLTTISERASRSWDVTFGNLKAGKYKARVAVAGPDLAKVVDEFEITIRDRPLYALLPIAFGVCISFLLHHYLKTGRANRLRQISLMRVLNQVKRDLEQQPESAVWQKLLGDLRKLETGLRIDNGGTPSADFDIALSDIDKRRKLFLDLFTKCAELDRVLASYPSAYEAKRREFEERGTRLRGVIELRLQESLVPDGKLAAVDSKLAEFEQLNDQARRHRLIAPIEAILKECTDFKTWIATDDSRSEGFKGRLNDLLEKVSKIHAAATQGELGGLEQRLNAVSVEYSRLRVDDLDAQLEQLASSRTEDIATNQWKEFDAAIQDARVALTQSKAAEPMGEEQSRWIRQAALSAQLAQVEYLQVAVNNSCPSDVPQGKWQEWIDDAQVYEHLADARKAASDSDPPNVLTAFQKARAGFQSALQKSIALRVKELIELVQRTPGTLNDQQWTQALNNDDFKVAIDELRALGESKDHSSTLRMQRKFISQRINVLQHAVEACQGLLVTPPKSSDKPKHIETLKNIAAQLAQAQQRLVPLADSHELLPQQSLREANQLVENAQDAYQAFVDSKKVVTHQSKSFTALRNFQTPTTILHMPQMTGPPVTQGMQATELPPPKPPVSEEELIRAIESDDWKVKVAMMCLATAGGFTTLYLPNEIWGAWSDYGTAVLWGFGLNEASNGILTNLSNKGLWPK